MTSTSTVVISQDMKVFLEAGCSIRVGTRSNDMVPAGVMGWGGRVSADARSVEVFIDRPSSLPTVDNLRTNGQIAVVFTDCKTDRSIQLKGRCIEIGEPAPDDWAWVDEQREVLLRDLCNFGYSEHMVRNFWSSQVIRLRFVVSQVFDQTPGVGAGRAI